MAFVPPVKPNTTADSATPAKAPGSFARITEEQLEAHLRVDRYGDFLLTDAIRPSYDLQIVPRQGYRHDRYDPRDGQPPIPVLMAAASRPILFDLFMELIEPLGPVADVVLETSHRRRNGGHDDLYREHIDLPVLKSILYDYEDLLLNDGCTGIAVVNPHIPQEVQFDEHKLLICYGRPLGVFEGILAEYGVRRDPSIRFITEAEHVHSSSESYYRRFQQLCCQLGLDENW
ncbi:MAG: hypothetical protein KatS3mg109_1533 [Pirellulaceae bacterium]|nr:MAG: hypothetical protein KatS3mg109_1533 [Pirellulaceae bacterium]GIW93294.1 MAG: hypothetical protein KatS3mg110_1335 [Pirellulaceae bacterium]